MSDIGRPKLKWRTKEVRDAKHVEHLLWRAADDEQSSLREAVWVQLGRLWMWGLWPSEANISSQLTPHGSHGVVEPSLPCWALAILFSDSYLPFLSFGTQAFTLWHCILSIHVLFFDVLIVLATKSLPWVSEKRFCCWSTQGTQGKFSQVRSQS